MYLCGVHVNIQHRFNPSLGKEGLYYRLKESYRDVRGNVHSLIVLNVGFVPELDANQMRRIAYALTSRFRNRNSGRIFGDDLEMLTPSKAFTEASMNRQWRHRFEDLLRCANEGIRKKHGTKRYEKVIERVGRAIQQYPSIAKYYDISYERDDERPELMKRVNWQIKDLTGIEGGHGVYFLRTNVRTLDERTTWDYYNLIREIETTNRQLKTDLQLRPIYHRKDSRSDAHLFFGLLAYWIVNTIRHQLKQNGIKCYWTEIVRRMSTQKLVTTQGLNPLGERVELRQCSRPTKTARIIYKALALKEAPFKKIKICRTQPPPD